MDIIKQTVADFVAFMTKVVFETDFCDYRISLAEKMREETHIFFILGPLYIKAGLITQVPAKKDTVARFIIEESTVLQENTITDQKQFLEWGLKHPKFKQIEESQKVKRYIIGFCGEQTDAISFLPTAQSLLALDGKHATPDAVIPILTQELFFNQEEFLANHDDLATDKSLRLGFLPVNVINHYLIIGEKLEMIQHLVTVFRARGSIIRLASLPLNALREAFTDGIIEDKQMGLVLLLMNRTLVAFGWNKQDTGYSFMRYRRIPEDKTYRATPKDSLLGRAIIEAASVWQKSCRIKNLDNMGLFYREFPGPNEPVLERAVTEIFAQAQTSTHILDFKAAQMKSKETNHLPAELDVFALMTD